MYLLIDDLRDVPCDIIARTPDAAYEVLRRLNSVITCVIFDHDLGEDVDTGYDIMKWMFGYGFLPNEVQLVTSNPVGRSNMQAALKAEGYVTKNNLIWKREGEQA